MKIATLLVLIGAALTFGMTWGAVEFVSQLPRSETFTDIQDASDYGRACQSQGRTYNIRTIWPEAGPRVPEAFVVTCRTKR